MDFGQVRSLSLKEFCHYHTASVGECRRDVVILKIGDVQGSIMRTSLKVVEGGSLSVVVPGGPKT